MIPMNDTTDLREQPQIQNDEVRRKYNNTITMDESLTNQDIYTVKDTYLKDLNNNYTVFLRFTCRDLLRNLID